MSAKVDTLTVYCPDDKTADAVVKAIKPHVETGHSKRTKPPRPVLTFTVKPDCRTPINDILYRMRDAHDLHLVGYDFGDPHTQKDDD